MLPALLVTVKLRAVFDEFDLDHSGAVSNNEMFQMVDSLDLGIEPEELARLIKQTDADESGEIDFEEFVAALQHHLAGDGDGSSALGAGVWAHAALALHTLACPAFWIVTHGST